MREKQSLPGKQAGRSQHLQVWYDSECPLCRREIDLLKRLDSKQSIHFIKIEE
ncbi:MAG: DCC1-like thiol-disulfide oxidoreductase family protein, partial [Candidatus Thiodiazotropha taylori]